MEDLKKLKRIRGGLKSVITRTSKDLDAFLLVANAQEIKAKLLLITTTHEKLKVNNEKIYELLNDEDYEEALGEDSIYDEEVYEIISRLEVLEPATRGPNVNSSGFKLPKLNLFSFHGDITKWVEFWEIFECSIHNNNSLSKIQKLTYLKGQLGGEAAKLVSGFKLEANSYDPAIQLLKDNYGRKDRISYALITDLTSMTKPQNNSFSLKQFMAKYESLYKSLITHDINRGEICATMLINYLPVQVQENIKRTLKEEVLDIDKVLDCLRTELFTMEGRTLNVTGTDHTVDSFSIGQEEKKIQKVSCKLCSGYNHPWFRCLKYPTANSKVKRAQDLSLCKGCLAGDHGKKGCINPKINKCKKCGGKHNFALCTNPRRKDLEREETNGVQTLTLTTPKERTILPTIMLPIIGRNNKVNKQRALLDQCSQKTFVLRSQLHLLKHEIVEQETLKLQGFTGSKQSQQYDIASIYYKYKGREYSLKAVVTNEMPQHKGHKGLDRDIKRLKNMNCVLADPNISDSNPISILVGGDYYYDLVHPGYERDGTLILLPTICGYALTGTRKIKEENTQVEVVTVLKLATTPLEEKLYNSEYIPPKGDLNKLWELDHIGILSDEITKETRDTVEQFKQSISYDKQSNQYSVKLPWRDNKAQLPSNYGLALGRIRSLQQTFLKNKAYCDQYTNVLADQLDRGFIEIVPNDKKDHDVHYLSHHGIKKDSITTPVRIVYDCSAKQTPQHLSLNDCLVTGPNLVPDLAQVLLRFRLHKYAFISDIEKAFLMVGLNEADRDYTRFLWPRDPLNTTSPFDIFRFKVVLFGSTCSQYLLNATIDHHLSNIKHQDNIIAEIKNGLYIDNLQGTSNNEHELLNKYWQIQQIFNKAHLYLRGWVTNSDIMKDQLTLDGVLAKELERTKVLGLIWNASSDMITFKLSNSNDSEVTKRSCLSLLSKLFDPLGLLTPVTIKSRMFLQNLWTLKIAWDKPLEENLCEQWQELREELFLASEIQLPRITTKQSEAELHIFSDASNKAYGACAYLCHNGEVTLIMGKAKVAPLKSLTIPKLELTAVLLAARLSRFILAAYNNILKINLIQFWCDSQIALCWLQSSKTLPTYVANRVKEIKDLTPNSKVQYVATKDNPADLLTRGLPTRDLLQSQLWWEGPSWLPYKEQWPESEVDHSIEVYVVKNTYTPAVKIIDWERHSTYTKCLRVMAWICRYINNLKRKVNGLAITTDPILDADSVKTAEKEIIKLVQREGFDEEFNLLSKGADTSSYTDLMLQLGLYLHNDIIICSGRIQTANLPEATKHPILLPRQHPLTKLLIIHCHTINHHYGVNATVAYIREKWWIPKIRQCVKGALRDCMICKRYQCKPYSQLHAPALPTFRTNPREPFSVTGVDYTGALKIKGENNQISKAYIVLFTCTVTRAVHLDLVPDLTSQCFLHAFKRFTSRQGLPNLMLSDNATTFVNVANFLDEIRDDPQINEHLASINCTWKFIPARAPWFGAIWERLIGILKVGLKKILGKALVTYDELHTILIELEATINDRPLTYTNSDINELNPITPSQLLRGRRLKSFPNVLTDDLTDPPFNSTTSLRERHSYMNKLLDHLWKRWTSEYLLSLRESHKCLLAKAGTTWPRVGDVVLIHDDGPRSRWKLGKVIGLHSGWDGSIRVVELKVASGTATRPIVKLFPLEQGLDDQSESVVSADAQGAACHQRPMRHAASKATSIWQSRIQSGQL